MFHLSQFFSTNDLSKQAALVALPPFPSQIRHCLITGPEHRHGQDLFRHNSSVNRAHMDLIDVQDPL